MKKYLIVLIVSLIISNGFILITHFYDPIASHYRYTTFKLGENLHENFGEIASGIEVRQSLVAERDNLSGINIFLSTYNRSNIGETTINIMNNDSEILRSVKIKNNEVEDNKYKYITFAPIENIKNKVLFITITSQANKDNALTIWRDNKTDANTKLYVNNVSKEGTLVFDLIYENKLNLYKIVLINSTVLLLNFFVYYLFKFLKR